ncbi:anti-sigma factor antagonist [Kribbella italica]|uniref:Anti-sigma factor antagonist n=1 Tax=Kribbella italica TaxID=1540520 RepID=A0A7W9J3D2_9ACTN|nr:anti-sigma B factor antagonist [Kribbella italica]
MSDSQLLTVTTDDRGTDVVATVAGELDFGTTGLLIDAGGPVVAAGRALVLDLSGLAFCDSSGLGALVQLHHSAVAAGGSLTLAALRPRVDSVIRVTMLHRLLTVVDQVPARS